MRDRKEHDHHFLIQWDLTERCNLRCRHCRQEDALLPEMPFPSIMEAFQEITDTAHAREDASGMPFVPRFTITGGEPFLRNDLARVLEMLTRPNFEVFLCTNGTLVDRDRARMLADQGIAGVQVSIEGPDDIHDSLRGEGSFDRAIDGIDHLLDAGLKVTVHVALSKLNAHCMMKVVAFASHMGVHRIGCSRLLPCGRGGALTIPTLSPDEIKALYRSLFALELRNIEIVSGDPLAALEKPNGPAKGRGKRRNGHGNEPVPSGGCTAGVSGITVLSDGTMVPCRRLGIRLGNLRDDSLREIWAASPVIEALRSRDRYPGRCGRCSRWEHCRGCRAIAYAASALQGRPDFLAD
ncbi:MAG TPA: radical SAM protein, partial [Nitrospirota bacterium]|nr:radical SAM protein [Nitrospirota bacterium]